MSYFPADREAELRQLFFESAQELLQVLNEEALKLETDPANPETARTIRRTTGRTRVAGRASHRGV